MRRCLLLLFLLAVTPGCLVLSLQPAYDDDSLAWDPALVGTWRDADDNASLKIDAADGDVPGSTTSTRVKRGISPASSRSSATPTTSM